MFLNDLIVVWRFVMRNKKKKNVNKKIFFLVVILVSSLAALISMEYGKTVADGKFASSQNRSLRDFEYDASSKADFAVFNEGIFFCTKDGMQYVNSSGETLWNDTYNMTIPYMIQDGGIVAVSEHKGRVLVVYDSEGKLYSAQTNNPIVSFSVNNEGFSSIITSSENEYQLEVYNSKGDKAFLGKFQTLQGIPVSSDISQDGNILAVGFLNINDISISSRISFYDISPKYTSEGETNNSVFASFNEENASCGVINFLSNNMVVVVSDKSLKIVNVNPLENEKYFEKSKIEFKNQIKQIAFDENLNIYMSFGDKLINSGSDALESGTIVCYDKDGVKKFDIQTNKKVSGIYPGKDSVLIGTDMRFRNYTQSGVFLWEYNTTQDTKKMLLIDEQDLILFVGSNKASIIKLNEMAIQTQEGEDFNVQEMETATEQTSVVTTVQEIASETVTQEQIKNNSQSDNENREQSNNKNNSQDNAQTSTQKNNQNNSQKANNQNNSNSNNHNSSDNERSNSNNEKSNNKASSTNKNDNSAGSASTPAQSDNSSEKAASEKNENQKTQQNNTQTPKQDAVNVEPTPTPAKENNNDTVKDVQAEPPAPPKEEQQQPAAVPQEDIVEPEQ